MNNEKRIALIVLKGEPTHNGHFYLFTTAIRDNDEVIVVYGSAEKSRTPEHPFNIQERKEMFGKLFYHGKGSKIKLLGVNDIGVSSKLEWATYVMEQLKKNNLPTPNQYYAGSKDDADWFDSLNHNEKVININIVDRLETKFLSGREIRQSIMNDGNEWIEHVPKCLVQYIKDNFPKELILSNILKKQKIMDKTLIENIEKEIEASKQSKYNENKIFIVKDEVTKYKMLEEYKEHKKFIFMTKIEYVFNQKNNIELINNSQVII